LYISLRFSIVLPSEHLEGYAGADGVGEWLSLNFISTEDLDTVSENTDHNFCRISKCFRSYRQIFAGSYYRTVNFHLSIQRAPKWEPWMMKDNVDKAPGPENVWMPLFWTRTDSFK